jgi:hypothetical protein
LRKSRLGKENAATGFDPIVGNPGHPIRKVETITRLSWKSLTVSLSIQVVCSLISAVALIEERTAGTRVLESSILLNQEEPAKYDEFSLDRGQAIGPVQYATGSKWGGGNAGSSCNGSRAR